MTVFKKHRMKKECVEDANRELNKNREKIFLPPIRRIETFRQLRNELESTEELTLYGENMAKRIEEIDEMGIFSRKRTREREDQETLGQNE